jgi:hypothetical protein
VLGLRDLNRTLLRRQHLLERTTAPAVRMVEHLLGLQAQDNLPPYLSLDARIDGFEPAELSAALEASDVVRLLTLRGTIHVLTPDDALVLRPWVQPALDQVSRSNQLNKPASSVPVEDVVSATRTLLAEGPLPVKQLGERLEKAFEGVPGTALAHVARERAPLVQLPPRGLWKRSGGVVYQTVENHLGRSMGEPDVHELVRRYLNAFGPATAADMTAWSRVTRLTPVFKEMAATDELEVVECADGRRRYDVPGAPRVDGDEPAPVRLLGTYDNVFLSHADRSHVVPDDVRARWMGPNGGVAHTVFVDGFMGGLWRHHDGRVEPELFVELTRAQRGELDEEVARTEALLAS